jgi:transcriptional regulator with XRE-family HTH domain
VYRLKFLRLEQGTSQRALAARAKMSNADLCRIESGRTNPSDRELKALGTALGCAPERLMDHVSEASLEPGAEARDDRRA